MLTDTKVKNARAPAGKDQVDLTDRDGLVLRVAARAKSWVWRYRTLPEGASRRLSLGHYPTLGLAEARMRVGVLVTARLAARDAGEPFDPCTPYELRDGGGHSPEGYVQVW